MTHKWKQGYWQLKLASSLVVAGLVNTAGDYAKAQISSDGTVPTNVTTPDNLNFTITDGKQAGSNLFHSFREFSVPNGGSAFFNNAPDIQNIITRVTGGSASNIDGLLKANHAANLFLLNPNGIIFGPNARLEIGGSFVGSTASSLKFADGTEFSATNPQTTPLLTVSVPIGLQYGGTAGRIVNQSRPIDEMDERGGLQVQPGNTLALVGGDVELDGGALLALGGRIEVGGLAGEGTVGLNGNGNNLNFNFDDAVARADVSLTNGSIIGVTAEPGGSIGINARNINVLGGSILQTGIGQNLGSVGIKAGDITLNATEAITIGQASQIQNYVQPGATGDGGNINVRARSLSLIGDLTGETTVDSTTEGQGNAGSISIQVDDSVSVAGISLIRSVVAEDATGNGGNINVRARSLSLTDGGGLQATTFAAGDAGNIQVNATDLVELSGVAPFPRLEDGTPEGTPGGYSSGLFTNTEAGASGQGNEISVTTGTLRISDGAVLTARSRSAFRGGNINVNANVLDITGGGQLLTTGFSSGDPGNISLNVSDRITISGSDPTYFDRFNSVAEAFDQQRAEATIDPVNPASGIFANARASAGGGNITILEGGSIQLSNNSRISTEAGGNGNGGNITINADTLVGLENSDIVANANQGQGGFIQITARGGIFGLEPREQLTEDSDITAFSEKDPLLSGLVEINRPDVDPSLGLVTLPTELVDASNQIATGCAAGGESVASNQFIITGRGGLPPNPSEVLRSTAVQVDLGNPSSEVSRKTVSSSQRLNSEPPPRLVEAQGWVIGSKGEVILTASAPTVTPHGSWLTTPSCQGR